MARPYRAKVKTITVSTGSQYDFNSGLSGRKITFKVQPVRGGISIRRGGRRGGVRSADKVQGGMVVCTAEGVRSKCIKGKGLIVFPGGSAKVKRWETAPSVKEAGGRFMLNGYSRKNRRIRRTRRGSKRRG